MEEYVQLMRLKALIALNNRKEADSLSVLVSLMKFKGAALPRIVKTMLTTSTPSDSKNRLTIADKLTREIKESDALFLTASLADSLKETAIAKRCRIDLLRLRKINLRTDSVAYQMYSKRKKVDEKLLIELARFLEWRMKWDELYTLALEAFKTRKENRGFYIEKAFNAAYRKRQYFESLRILRMWEKYEGRTHETLFKYALNLEKLQHWRAAWIMYKKYLTRWPKGVYGDNFIWDLGRRLEKRGKFDRAAVVYLDLERVYPREGYASESRFRAAYSIYKMGLLDSALSLFSGFASRYPNDKYTVASIYWTGRTHEDAGRIDSANLYYSRTMERDPMSIHAILAEERMAIKNTSVPYSLDNFIDSIDDEVKGDDEDPLPVKRGVLLMQCGFYDMAVEEFDNAAKWTRRKVERLFRIAKLYEKAGYYTKAYRTSMEISYRIPLKLRSVIPTEIYKMFFPRYFGESVDLESRKLGIDPLFVHSVMRQESQFDHTILSRAGAIGLLQMMPATAKATALKSEERFAVDSLSHPFYNIKLSTYHLSELLDRFNGSMEWTLAAYNAGTNPALRWKNETAGMPYDRTLEEIAYSETRQYVKLCMRNYHMYKKIWNK
jgi:TolA-binding protein